MLDSATGAWILLMNEHHQHHGHSSKGTEAAQDVIRDPVCGMVVDPAAGKPTLEREGHLFHFCSAGCRDKFVKEPEKYISATDPVCGMSVDRSSAKNFLKHEGSSYYFCSPACEGKFKAEPAKYLGGKPAAQAAPAGTQYTLSLIHI